MPSPPLPALFSSAQPLPFTFPVPHRLAVRGLYPLPPAPSFSFPTPLTLSRSTHASIPHLDFWDRLLSNVSNNWSIVVSKATVSQLYLMVFTQKLPDILASSAQRIQTVVKTVSDTFSSDRKRCLSLEVKKIVCF